MKELTASRPVHTERRPDTGAEASDAEHNVYLIDEMYEDIGDNWRMIGRARIGMSHWGAYDPWRPISEIVIEPNKAGHMVHGLERRGLGLPLPQAIRFRVWSETGYLWVVLGDRQGRRSSSIIPISGLKPRLWCEIELPLADTAPMGVGAEPIHDLDLIAFLTRESSGEVAERSIRLGFRNLQAIYPQGTGPINPVVTRESLESLLSPLDPAIEEIDRLLSLAREQGLDVRYPAVSRAVLDRYRREVFSMIHPMDPLAAYRTPESYWSVPTAPKPSCGRSSTTRPACWLSRTFRSRTSRSGKVRFMPVTAR
jgi:hypothetical protein